MNTQRDRPCKYVGQPHRLLRELMQKGTSRKSKLMMGFVLLCFVVFQIDSQGRYQYEAIFEQRPKNSEFLTEVCMGPRKEYIQSSPQGVW